MVKLSRSRKNVRKSKRSSSRKSGKFMVGGDYVGEGKYIRTNFGLDVYALESKKEGDNTIYTLDFSVAGKVVGAAATAEKYTQLLQNAMGVVNNSTDATNIKDIITKLFQEGSDGARKKKLIITQPKPAAISLQLIEGDTPGESRQIDNPDQFGGFLLGLGSAVKKQQ